MTSNAAVAPATFEYDASVQEYMVSERQYLHQNPQYQVLAVGVAVFNAQGKLLLVRRAKTEKAFPELWEIPGGKVDEPDATLVHGAVRELREEAGLEATRVVGKVGSFVFFTGKKDDVKWVKHIFEMEVKHSDVVLDPVEHDDYLWASEDEVMAQKVGDVTLKYVSDDNKSIKMDAFRGRHRRVGDAMAMASSELRSDDGNQGV